MPSGAYFLPCCSRLCPDTPAEPPWCCPPPAKKNGIALQAIFCKKVLTTPPGYGIILKQSGGRHNRWGFSSAGRALAWHARGHRFDPGNLHQFKSITQKCVVLLLLQTAQQQRGFRSAGRAGAWAASGHRDLNSPVISTNLKALHRNVWCFCFYRTLSASFIAPPLGELSPKVTERARMLVPIAVTRRFCQKGADLLRHG